MKVLITGSSGLVGRALQEVIAGHGMDDENHYVYLSSKDGDLTKESVVSALFDKHRPDALVHLAANVGGLYKNMHKRAEMLEDNLLMNTLVLKYARLYQLKKVVVILSTCIFPDKVEPLTEEKLHMGAPHPSNEGYAYAKRLQEVHARILYDKHNVHTIVLTPTNLYGAHDNFHLEDAHVIPALIRKCYMAKEKHEPFVVCGSGRPLRQFIYSRDFAGIIWEMLHRDEVHHGHFICSPPSSQEVSIAEVARKIASCMDYEYALVFDDSFADGQYKKTVEPHPMIQDRVFTPFDEGIAETVRWFVEQMGNKPSSVRL